MVRKYQGFCSVITVTVLLCVSIGSANTVQSQDQSYGIDLSQCSFLIAPTDSWWTRDYGPWFIINEDSVQGVVDFIYNRPRPNDDLIPARYASHQSLPLTTMSLQTAGGHYI